MTYATIEELTGMQFDSSVTGYVPQGAKVWSPGVYPAAAGPDGNLPYSGGYAQHTGLEWNDSIGGDFSQQAGNDDPQPQIWHYPSGLGRTYSPHDLWYQRVQHLNAFEGFTRSPYTAAETNHWAEGNTSFGDSPTTWGSESGMKYLDSSNSQDQIVTDVVSTSQTVAWQRFGKETYGAHSLISQRMREHITRGRNEFDLTVPPNVQEVGYDTIWRPHPGSFAPGTTMNDITCFGTETWTVSWKLTNTTGRAAYVPLTVGLLDDPNLHATGYPRNRVFATPSALRSKVIVQVPRTGKVDVVQPVALDDYVEPEGLYTFMVTLWWHPSWEDLWEPPFGSFGFSASARVQLSYQSNRITTYTSVLPALQFGYVKWRPQQTGGSIPLRQSGRTDGLIGAARQGRRAALPQMRQHRYRDSGGGGVPNEGGGG